MMSQGTAIVPVSTATHDAQVLASHVYFAFGSGRFEYDCHSCGGACCKGHGYAGTRAEIEHQIALKPALSAFVSSLGTGRRRHRSDVAFVSNCAPACFFLDEDKLCSVHSTFGAAAKPETCRLFPFNDFRIVGPYLIVLPHPGLCPLALVPPTRASALATHDGLLAALVGQGLHAPVTEAVAIEADVDRLIAIERAIVDRAESDATVSLTDFCEAQGQIASTALPSARPPSLSEFEASLSAALGERCAELEEAPSDVSRLLIAVAPSVRARLIFRKGASATATSVPLSCVPLYFRVLSEFVLRARRAGLANVTYQTVIAIEARWRDLFRLLSFACARGALSPNVPIDLSWSGSPGGEIGFIRVVQDLLRPSSSSSETLGEILNRRLEGGAGRIAQLDTVAKRLAPCLVGPGIRTKRGFGLRARVQRTMLRYLDEQAVLRIRARFEGPTSTLANRRQRNY